MCWGRHKIYNEQIIDKHYFEAWDFNPDTALLEFVSKREKKKKKKLKGSKLLAPYSVTIFQCIALWC